METVLSDFPLDEGIAVPVANAENKQLEVEVTMLCFCAVVPGGECLVFKCYQYISGHVPNTIF